MQNKAECRFFHGELTLNHNRKTGRPLSSLPRASGLQPET